MDKDKEEHDLGVAIAPSLEFARHQVAIRSEIHFLVSMLTCFAKCSFAKK